MAGDIDRIKEKLDIVELVRSYLPLQPAGKNFKALCPFHQEKTPSFIVSPERQTWHCFGCSEGGDGIKFLMRYENLEFPEALRVLAERLGVELDSFQSREQKEFGLLYDIHESAKQFFKTQFEKNSEAQSYLQERKLTKATVEEFDIGYAPGGESLTLHLLQRGYDMNVVARAGLAHKNSSGLYRDRFGGRIIFPLVSAIGKTIGFAGRLLPSLAEDATQPKYLNSPETPIFQKSKFLYGFFKAKTDIATQKSAFLVEGYMDVALSRQVGIKNVVAISGTALTQQHLERLRRIADTVYVSFDNDDAGLRALERSLDVLSTFDFHVRAVDLGVFKDPADAANGDPAFLKRAIENALPAFSHLVVKMLKLDSGTPLLIAEKKRVIRNLLQKIQKVGSAVEQHAWITELSKQAGISEVALSSELSQLPLPREERKSTAENTSVPISQALARVDLIAGRVLALAFTNDKFFDILRSKKSLLPPRYQKLLDNPNSEETSMYQLHASYLFNETNPDATAKEFGELLRQLESESLLTEREKAKEIVRRAGAIGNEKELSEAIKTFDTIAKRIDELKL